MTKLLAPLLFCVALLSLSPARAAEDLLITEFMAANGSTLSDENRRVPRLDRDPQRRHELRQPRGLVPDGLELPTCGNGCFPRPISRPRRTWSYSRRARIGASPGAPLHTSFSLGAGGEYLALVRPDGTNVASVYAPLFPPQASDTSFGIVTAAPGLFALLSTERRCARAHVPVDGALGCRLDDPHLRRSARWNAGHQRAGV